MINVFVIVGVVIVIVALVILSGKLGPHRLTGPGDKRDQTQPNPGREGR